PIHITTRPRVNFVPPGIVGSELGVSFSQLSKMFRPVAIGDRFVLGGGTWPSRRVDPNERISTNLRGGAGRLDKTTSLDLFDGQTGELVYSLDADDAGIARLLASDREGRVYAELVGDTPV